MYIQLGLMHMHVSSKYFLQAGFNVSWYVTFLSLLQLAPYCCGDEVIMLHELLPDVTATTTTNNHPSMQIDAAPTVSS